jgi:cyclophilin family peptidyl-prolyl cis-trans isomerase
MLNKFALPCHPTGRVPLWLAGGLLVLLVAAAPWPVYADGVTARAAMTDARNPLMELSTSRGNLYIELFPEEAPNNVRHFMALAAGEIAILDPATNTEFRPRYYDGMRFHRVLPNFIIQAGSPVYHPLGAPDSPLADEINADALGLNRIPVMNADGSFNSMLNITSKSDFDTQILKPLYATMGITALGDLRSRQNEVLEALQGMTVKTAYENQGYRYQTRTPSHPVTRGVVALANQGPDSNGAEFFISLSNANWLSGRYTVIGQVIEGMEIADAIGQVAIDPSQFSRQSTVIYSINNLD